MKICRSAIALLFSFVASAAYGQSCVGTTTSSGAVLQQHINAVPAGATLYLCQGAVFTATSHITLKPGLKVETLGRPADDNLKARISLTPSTTFPFPIGQAFISAYGMSGVQLRNIVIDGGRSSVGVFRHKILEVPGVSPDHHRATLAIGGANSLVDSVSIVNGIGGAAIDAASDPNCNGLQIKNSYIANVGFHQRVANDSGQLIGQWSDGLNLFCSNAHIANNHFRDITDGSITLYGGTNTVIESNWIASSGRSGVSAFVAAAALKGKPNYNVIFTGSVFRFNLIETSASQHFNVLISLGSKAWCNPPDNNPDCQSVSGMSAVHNSGQGNFGLGLVVAGMDAATMTNNAFTMYRWINPDWNISRPAGGTACQGPDLEAPAIWPAANYYILLSGSTGTVQQGYRTRSTVNGCAWIPDAY